MNEQIAKIAKQAGLTLSVDQQVAFQRAAELIVKECAKIAGKAEYSDTWLEPVEDAIKKHFGVEE
jgi:malate synthase